MRWAPPCLPVILATWALPCRRGLTACTFAPGNAAALADAVRKLQNVGETFDLTAMQQKSLPGV